MHPNINIAEAWLAPKPTIQTAPTSIQVIGEGHKQVKHEA